MGEGAGIEPLLVRDAAAFHRWLDRNHAKSQGVVLILAKKGTLKPTSLTYDQALEQALCYGWIDGQGRSRDEATYQVRFTPRRQRSAWSKRNTEHAEQLVKAGRMHPAGQAEIDRAKADGRWQTAYAGPASIEVPDDLAQALRASRAARVMFDRLSSQNRYAILLRTQSAKRPETRARRIEQFVAMLARGETIYPQRPPKST